MAQPEERTTEVHPPVLRIIRLESILPHEEFDTQRAEPLVNRIAESREWLHPPIVTPLPDSHELYVLLDGTNRCFSLQKLGYPHILVQVVEYNSGQVNLDRWNHVITGLPVEEFLPDVAKIEGTKAQSSDLLTAQSLLAQREAAAYIVNLQSQSEVITLCMDDHSAAMRAAALRALVDTYKTRGRLERLNSSDRRIVHRMFPEATALVVFPHYEPAEILTAARDKIFLPPGISRHIIEGRAMRLHYPLEALQDPHVSLAKKNEDLQNWIRSRIDQRGVRFYAESTYLFDE